jgi:hypothetical protein
MLPWAMPALSSYLSINWMLNGQWGLINNLIWQVAQVDGPPWLDNSGFALGSVIYGHIWKWLPFWTLIFLAGRMAISVELYEAADVDGASLLQKFTHVTLPLMAGMYLVCTMLSTIWALGDFNAVRFISGGGPALSTHVLATLGIRNAFELGDPKLGMATVLTPHPGDRSHWRDVAVGGAAGLDAAADLQHHPRVHAGKGGGAQHLRLPDRAQLACVQRCVPPGLLAAGHLLEPDGQQFLYRCRCRVIDPDHRVPDQFHHQPDAHSQRMDADQRGAADLCDPVVVPCNSFLRHHGQIWPDQ